MPIRARGWRDPVAARSGSHETCWTAPLAWLFIPVVSVCGLGRERMEFRILGCLEAESASRCLPLGGPLDRRLLAVLLLEAGRVVPVARLADVLWAGDPPVTGGKQVRNAVSRLRLVLAAAGAPGLVVTIGSGYRLVVADDAVDARLFQAGVVQAEAAACAGWVAEAARLLRSALSLWRGPVLAGLTGPVIEVAAVAWEERRCAALEALYDHELALGRHREAVAELRAFAGEHPLRDKPAGQLMLALYRCGRQADALACYDKIKGELAAGLGLDPSLRLQRLRQHILTDDPAIAGSEIANTQKRAFVRNERDGAPVASGL